MSKQPWNDRKAKHKRAVINRYKHMRGCVDCGYKADHRALEFDHIDENTKCRSVGSCCYSSWARIKEEIAKCVIRCANCHAIRTHARYHRKPRVVERKTRTS